MMNDNAKQVQLRRLDELLEAHIDRSRFLIYAQKYTAKSGQVFHLVMLQPRPLVKGEIDNFQSEKLKDILEIAGVSQGLYDRFPEVLSTLSSDPRLKWMFIKQADNEIQALTYLADDIEELVRQCTPPLIKHFLELWYYSNYLLMGLWYTAVLGYSRQPLHEVFDYVVDSVRRAMPDTHAIEQGRKNVPEFFGRMFDSFYDDVLIGVVSNALVEELNWKGRTLYEHFDFRQVVKPFSDHPHVFSPKLSEKTVALIREQTDHFKLHGTWDRKRPSLKVFNEMTDAVVTKTPLVPCIFGYVDPHSQLMKYVATLSHKNSSTRLVPQGEFPTTTLESTLLLHKLARKQPRAWYPVGLGNSPEIALDYLCDVLNTYPDKVSVSSIRNTVWFISYLLGEKLMTKSIQEIEDNFTLPTWEEIIDYNDELRQRNIKNHFTESDE